ncbi:MAG TPA: hypothetical protein VKZ89_05205 [Thermobifida alba]|nr:hypothetical protein [Thermobifida alba]
MTAVRDHDQGGRRYRVVCAGCGTAHTPPLVPRTASDARLLARRDGWRAPTAKKKRRTQTDQCPTCKQKENALMATADQIAVATQPKRRKTRKGEGRDYTPDLEQLTPAHPVTPEEEAAVRALLADQPDADVLADMLGVAR